MRKKNIKKILFSSTGSIYGEAKRIPTPENYEIPLQTSMYAASKFSAESFIQAYSEAYNIKSVIFRFVSVLGNRYTHGHVFDFYKKLSLNPKKLNVLGNGLQKKSYMHIDDCCEAVYYISKYKLSNKVEIFNLGFNGYCEVRDSVKWITNYLGLKPKIFYGKENKGWIGDNPFIFLDTKKINKLGWKPKKRIKESIEETLEYLVKNKWLLKRR